MAVVGRCNRIAEENGGGPGNLSGHDLSGVERGGHLSSLIEKGSSLPNEARRYSTSHVPTHLFHELAIVDAAVRVDLCRREELVDLRVRQLLAEVGEDVPQFANCDVSGLVLVKDCETSDELLCRQWVEEASGEG